MIYKNIVKKIKIKNEFIKIIFNKCIYIDIETSGLSAKNSSIVSITFLIEESGEFILYQTFSIDDVEEEESLVFLAQIASTRDFIITYNGNAFDINYLNYKMQVYNIKFNFSKLKSIDLYRDMLNFKSKLSLENNKLKTVEKYYGITREDNLSGKEVITLYNAYKIHKNDTHRDLILLHNYDDVVNLPFLFDKILDTYDKIIISDTFGLIKLNNNNIKFNNKSIKINLSTISNYGLDYNSDTLWYKLNFKKESSVLKIELYTSIFSTSSENYIIFLDNNDIGLSRFNTLPNLKDNIVPMVINGTQLNENIHLVIEKIINSL